MFRRLSDTVLVADRQLRPERYRRIRRGRRDGDRQQPPRRRGSRASPPSADIEAPRAPPGSTTVTSRSPAGSRPDQIEAMAAALAKRPRCSLFCRSGTRSTYLWALARAQPGHGRRDDRSLEREAAGYDLSPLRALSRLIVEHAPRAAARSSSSTISRTGTTPSSAAPVHLGVEQDRRDVRRPRAGPGPGWPRSTL